jgi:hypothetical protein
MNRLPSRRFPLHARGATLARALYVLAVLAVSLAFAPSALAAEPGQITGTVTNVSTAEPLNNVEVCARTEYFQGGSGCAETEPNGEYTITGLKVGEYEVEFSARGRNYLPQYYDGKASSSEAQLVSVAAGHTTPGIDAALQEGARITGEVRDASTHEALTGIQVCAISVSTGEAWCGTSVGLSGEYEIVGVPTGEYRVKFSLPFESGLNYVPQFYDDKLRSSEAQVLSIAAGSLTSGIDAELQEGGHVRGVVRDASSQVGIEGIEVCANEAGSEGGPCAETGLYGEYILSGLASGQYKVVFYPNGHGYLPGETTASVTAPGTTYEVSAELVAGGRVTGRVTSAATQAAIPNVQVCAREVGGKPGVQEPCATSGSNGEYTISPLPSGEYTITFSASTFGELDYFFYEGSTVKVAAGQTISGVDAALTEGGRITGRVTDATTGESIEDVEACAREVGGDGSQCGSTNANGEYTILRLNGAYAVEFRSRMGGYLAQFYGGEPPFEYGRFLLSPAQQVSVTAPGTVSGIDAALQPGAYAQPVNTAPPIVSGTAAVGSVLSCSPGSWTGDPAPATFTYRWRRDGEPIPGAEESAYTPQSADEGHELSCKVYAMNAAGSQTGTGQALSAGVIVAAGTVKETPPGGAPGPSGPTPPTETTTGSTSSALAATPFVTVTDAKVLVSGGSAPVRVACSQATCQGSIELVVQVAGKRHGGKGALARKQTLVLATGSFSLTQGKSGSVLLRLTAAGRQKLAHARRHPIAAKLVLSVKGGKTMAKPVLAG